MSRRVTTYLETLIYDVLRKSHEYEGQRKRLINSLITLKMYSSISPTAVTGTLVRKQWEEIKESYKTVDPKLFAKLNQDSQLQNEFKDFLYQK